MDHVHIAENLDNGKRGTAENCEARLFAWRAIILLSPCRPKTKLVALAIEHMCGDTSNWTPIAFADLVEMTGLSSRQATKHVIAAQNAELIEIYQDATTSFYRNGGRS